MYHHMLMSLSLIGGGADMMANVIEIDPRSHSLIELARKYADEVFDSLPEDDPDVLRQGLTGAFLSFFVDAALVVSDHKDEPVAS